MVFIRWVLGWGFLVGWGLRYRLSWFGGLGLKSWIGLLARWELRYRLLWFGRLGLKSWTGVFW